MLFIVAYVVGVYLLAVGVLRVVCLGWFSCLFGVFVWVCVWFCWWFLYLYFIAICFSVLWLLWFANSVALFFGMILSWFWFAVVYCLFCLFSWFVFIAVGLGFFVGFVMVLLDSLVIWVRLRTCCLFGF